jgi:EmrB/QacA subfamily drug resistance transporter
VHRRALIVEEGRKRRALLGVVLSIFLGAVESTVVATAMPTIVASLGGIQVYSWVFSGFLLTSTVTMPVWGRLSDLFGRRRMFLTGLTVFLAGSALSGLAQDMVQLVAFRMLQGLGAGSIMTIGMTIVGELFGLERRAKMQGYISGVWGLSSLLGPLLGGFLADHVSWRWVFYLNLPIGGVAMALIAGALRDETPHRRRAVMDYAGLGLFTVGVTALLVSVMEAGRSVAWARPEIVAPLVVAAVALGLFVPVERRAAEPIVPLQLFRNRVVMAAAVTGFLTGTAMFGAISFVPLFMQAVVGTTATGAGFVLTPFVLGWIALSVVSARAVLKLGYRRVVIAGMTCLLGAFFLMSRWDPTLTQGAAMAHVLLAGIGMGMNMVPMLIAVQSAVPRADLGAATSMTQFFRTIGGAIGLSLMGAVMTQGLGAGQPMAVALHGVFVVGLVVSAAAFASGFLVPGGRAQDLARADVRGEPTRVGG